jgi:hypothetical protein
MARIDRFIEACFTHGADSFLIASGERALMFTDGRSRPFTPQAATVSQVEALIREIAPPDQPAGPGGDSEYDFTYDSPSGTVNVVVSCAPGRAQVEIDLKGTPSETSLSDAGPATAAAARDGAPANPPSPPGAPVEAGAPAVGDAGRSEIAPTSTCAAGTPPSSGRTARCTHGRTPAPTPPVS